MLITETAISITIRKVTLADKEALFAIEEECFPQDHYPQFFFVQAAELYNNSFLIAEDDNGSPAGYIIGAPTAGNPSNAWILSMAIRPSCRKHGIGTALLDAIQKSLLATGVTKIILSVSEDNQSALSLYTKNGFSKERTELNYFGVGSTKIIMTKTLSNFPSPPIQSCLNPDRLLSEAGTSVSLSSVLFAVSAAILAFIVPRPDIGTLVTPVLLLCLAILSSFYSVLFYANSSGALCRINNVTSAIKPLQYGNAVSEYLGVFPLVFSFPLVIWGVTRNVTITTIACIIDILGFIFYQLTGFDMLSRIIKNRYIHVAVTLVISSLLILALIFMARGYAIAQYISVSAFLTICFVITIFGIRSCER